MNQINSDHKAKLSGIVRSPKGRLSSIIFLFTLILAFFSIYDSYGEGNSSSTLWGTQVSNEIKFSYPAGIATDSSGNVYVVDLSKDQVQKFSSDGKFITKWGTQGQEDGQFYDPIGIAVGPDGKVSVLESGSSRIQVFSGDGKFITKWSSFGTSNGLLAHPSGIAIDRSGNVYVADTDNHRIQKFSSDGKFIAKWPVAGNDTLSGPRGIAIDQSGNVYSIDFTNGVQKFSSDGNLIIRWDLPLGDGGQQSKPVGISVDSTGSVFVTDTTNRFLKFSSDGQFIAKWGTQGTQDGQFYNPFGIATDLDGNIYITDLGNGRVQKFASDGKFITKWGNQATGQVGIFPYSLTTDSIGNVFVSNNYTITKFTTDGNIITKWDMPLTDDGHYAFSSNMATDSSGNLYVFDDSSRVIKFSGDGKIIAKWKVPLEDIQSEFPSGIVVDPSGAVYLSEIGNDYIQKFANDGKLITQWKIPDAGLGSPVNPNGLALDTAGNLYTFDISSDRILKFTGNGNLLLTWSSPGTENGQLSGPEGIAIDSSGDIYVVDSGNNRIQKFSSEGQFITKWGSQGTGDGQFHNPKSIAIDRFDNIYVGDQDHGIQKFPSKSIFITKNGDSPPDANAGVDQTTSEGMQVSLDGSKSSDPDKKVGDLGINETIFFAWKQVGGPSVHLSNQNIENPTFIAPMVDSEEILTFNLTVTDYVGASSSDTVKVIIRPATLAGPNPFKKIITLSHNTGPSGGVVMATSGSHVYAAWEDNTTGNYEIFLKTSSDNGTSFSGLVNLSNTPNMSVSPGIVASKNNVYLIWSEFTNSTFKKLVFVASNDYGNHFTEPITISDTSDGPDGTSASILATDNVYVLWPQLDELDNGRAKTLLQVSKDNGNTFGATIPLLDNYSGITFGPPLMAASKNNLYFAWGFSSIYGSNQGIFFKQSRDGGTTFSDTIQLDKNNTRLDGLSVSGNNVYLLWQREESEVTPSQTSYKTNEYFVRSTDSGKTFDNVLPLSNRNAANRTTLYDANMVSSGDNVYVKWIDYDEDTHTNKIFLTSSTDGGKSFGIRTIIDSYPTILLAGSSYIEDGSSPQKLAANGSDVYLVYQSPLESGYDFHSFFSKSTNSGEKFEKRIPLNNGGGYSASPRIVLSDDSRTLHVAWINGHLDGEKPINEDIVYSSALIGEDGVLSSSNTSTVPEFGSLVGMMVILSIIGVVIFSKGFRSHFS